MDTSNHFEALIQDLVSKVQEKVNAQVEESIDRALADKLAEYDFDQAVAKGMMPVIDKHISGYQFDTNAINQKINIVAEATAKTLATDLRQQVIAEIAEEVKNINVGELILTEVGAIVSKRLETLEFPAESIPASALSFADFKLSGEVIQGGIIEKFGSTGIDDQASSCQLTILDTHVVVESPILTTGVDVRGDVKVTGNLILSGGFDTESAGYAELVTDTLAAIRESFDRELFLEFTDLVSKNIYDNGINFAEVKINGKTTLSETTLGPTVTQSNLRKVGELTELQVSGETFLGQTLYTSKKRVGINTIEPSAALSIWDEEIEILMGKKTQGRGFIGTQRQVPITLTANGKDNISLDVDGSVTINDLRLGALPISTASQEPNWDGRTGEIVFNDSPAVGQPIGWVCLQGHRWAKFGIIQE